MRLTGRTDHLVLGAGMAGLGAIDALAAAGADFLCLEAEPAPGGLARTDVVHGFAFDRAGHFLHIGSDRFRAAVARSGTALETYRRRAFVALDGQLIPYPLQFNLAAAPAWLRERVLAEPTTPDPPASGAPATLETHLRAWGEALFEAFLEPYNRKLWGRPLASLPADCLGRYLPPLDRDLVRQGAEAGRADYGYNSSFLYPRSGRIGSLAEALARPHGSRLRCGVRVEAIDLERRTCRTSAGPLSFGTMIATAAAPAFARLAGLAADPADFEATTLRVVGVAVTGAPIAEVDWVYAPDPQLPFHRISFTGRVARAAQPSGGQALLVETTVPASGPDRLASAEIAAVAVAWLREQGLLASARIEVVHEMIVSPAYVVDQSRGQAALQRLMQGYRHVFPAGRFATWRYQSMEESYLSGVAAAESALAAGARPAAADAGPCG